jgi:hypothetical protein
LLVGLASVLFSPKQIFWPNFPYICNFSKVNLVLFCTGFCLSGLHFNYTWAVATTNCSTAQQSNSCHANQHSSARIQKTLNNFDLVYFLKACCLVWSSRRKIIKLPNLCPVNEIQTIINLLLSNKGTPKLTLISSVPTPLSWKKIHLL